jgi:hypothetical protein
MSHKRDFLLTTDESGNKVARKLYKASRGKKTTGSSAVHLHTRSDYVGLGRVRQEVPVEEQVAEPPAKLQF